MDSGATTNTCPKCQKPVPAGRGECSGCGQVFGRLCRCGAIYSIFEQRCGECGRSHRRKWKAGRRRRLRAAAFLSEKLTAPFHAIAEPIRAYRKYRKMRKRQKAPRAFCPACKGTLAGPTKSCPHCNVDLTSACRCGARYHRLFDRRCAACGRNVKKKKRVGIPRKWLLVSAFVLVGAGAAVAVVAARRNTGEHLVRYFQQGLEALEEGRNADAISWFSRFLDDVPDDAPARFMLGECLYLSGSEEKGLAEMRRANELDPELDEPNLFLGRVALREGREEEARSLLKRTLLKDPRPAEAHFLLGGIHLRGGRIRQAMVAMARGVTALSPEEGPKHVEATLLLADLHHERFLILEKGEDASDARRYYGLVTVWLGGGSGLDGPADPVRDGALARAYLGLESFDEAAYRAGLAAGVAEGPTKSRMLLLKCRAILAQGPESAARAALSVEKALEADASAEGYLAVAAFWRRVGQTERWVEALDEARAKHPESLPVLTAWADGLAQTGRASESMESLRDREGFEEDPAFHLALARAAWSAGRDADALETLRAARSRFPGNAEIQLRAVSAHLDALGRKGAMATEAEWEAAEREVDDAFRDHPLSPVTLLLRGKSLLYRNRAVEAASILKEAVDADPTNLEAAIFVGLAYHRAGNYEDAAYRLRLSLARSGAELPGPRLALAESYYRLRLYQRATDVSEELVRLNPERPSVRHLYGRILIAQNRLDDATREFQTIEQLDPGRVDTALYLGYLSLLSGRATEAEQAFAQARERTTTPEEAFQVARVEAEYYRQARLGDRAQSVYETFVKQNPGHLQARIGLSDFLLSMGRKEEAMASYQRCLSLDPGDLSVRRRICEYYFEEGGDVSEVDRQIAEIARRSADAADLSYLRGKLEVFRGNLDRGIESLSAYVLENPEDADGHYALGVALHRNKEGGAAVEQLEVAAALQPHSMAIRHTLGQVLQARAADLYNEGRFEATRDLVKKALGYDPGLMQAQILLASSVAELGNLAGSEAYCLAAIRRDPENLDAIRLLGAIRERKGDLTGAADAYQRAATLSEEPSYERYLLAAVHLRLGNWAAALDEARQAKEGVADPLYAADVIATALLRSGEGREAEDYLRGLLRRVPDSPQCNALMGMVKRARGDLDGAIQSFAAALDFDQGYIWALWQLADLYLVNRGDRKKAEEEVAARYERSKDDPEMNYLMAWLRTSALEQEKALPYLEKALAVNPGHRHSAILYSKVATELGRAEDAREALKAVLEDRPRDAEALFLLASSFDQAGETDIAVQRYRQSVAANSRYGPALNNLAMHLLARPGGEREARSLIETALAEHPAHPPYLDTLGRVQMAMGNYTEAGQNLKEALKGFRKVITVIELRIVDISEKPFRERSKRMLNEAERQVNSTKEALQKVLRKLEGR